jgi:hypothetical protein
MSDVSLTALAFLIAACLYAGFQWTIRLLVYPQFAQVPTSDFPAYERNHQRLVLLAVGPLFAALGLTALAVLLDPPAGLSRWIAALAAVLVAALLALTAGAAVPLHRQLSIAFDARQHRQLLAVDSGRLILAGLSVVLAVVLVRG